MISASILDIKEPKAEEVIKLSSLDIDYLHVDVMDGIFVDNTTPDFLNQASVVKYSKVPLDVHLMVSDVKKYIDDYAKLNPEFITFHFEAVSDVGSIIHYIRSLGIKVGMAIRPSTSIVEIQDYLKYLNLVLVMSVEPGRGGQKFIENTEKKLEQLRQIKESLNLNFLIEVDGGINDETIMLCNDADICVVGSFITKNNYEESIKMLKDKIILD